MDLDRKPYSATTFLEGRRRPNGTPLPPAPSTGTGRKKYTSSIFEEQKTHIQHGIRRENTYFCRRGPTIGSKTQKIGEGSQRRGRAVGAGQGYVFLVLVNRKNPDRPSRIAEVVGSGGKNDSLYLNLRRKSQPKHTHAGTQESSNGGGVVPGLALPAYRGASSKSEKKGEKNREGARTKTPSCRLRFLARSARGFLYPRS